MGAYDEYAPRLASAAKWLHPGGSVTDADGDTILPPDAARAADYETRSPAAAKWLMPDGTIVSEFPYGGSPPGGEGNTPEQLPQANIPILADDALGDVFLSGNIDPPQWRDDIAEMSGALIATDSIVAAIS